MRKLIFTTILILAFCLAIFSQANENQIDELRITNLIQKVQAKSKVNRTAYLSEYERDFKVTIESESKNKTYTWDYEQYCLNDEPYCRHILIKENGKSRSSSKIKKEREKAAKDLVKNEDYVAKEDEDEKTFLVMAWV
jgi:hypothetical protein